MEVSQGRPHPLGSTYDGRGANFSVFSSVAERVEVCFFGDRGEEQRVALPGRTGPYWHGHVSSIEPGHLYGFRVHGPWDPAHGHLCAPERLLLDPYARAVYGSVRWDDALFPLNARDPSVPAHRTDTAPFVPRSVVVDPQFDWRGDSPPRTRLEDTLLYELHVKGFTIRNPRIPEELRGTYAGLAHPASIEYLTRLGVTAVELLPVQQFIHRREFTDRGLVNYWGYDPICFLAPHNEYAGDRSPGGAVREFKEMTRTMHSAGLEVILDIVFNHTGEGGALGPVLGLKGFDNKGYYRIETEKELRYLDYTGTFNTLETASPQVRRLIIESLRYWSGEMHVDGFRLDLAPVMAREEKRINFRNEIFETLRLDPLFREVKLIAEPWDLAENGYQLGRFPSGWSEWNDKFRDDVRDFWNGREGAGKRFALRFVGSPDVFHPPGEASETGDGTLAAARPPQASVNYVTCHDGFTLHDLVSYQQKHNEANGEGNRDGPDDNHSWNCGVEGPAGDAGVNALRWRQKRNFVATLLLAQGVPMLLGGDEMGRSQRGNNNAYCQDNEVSWYDWTSADEGLREFVASLIGFRGRHPVLRSGTWLPVGGEGPAHESRIVWYDAGGWEIRADRGAESFPLALQVSVEGSEGAGAPRGENAGEDDVILALFNPMSDQTVFHLPRLLAGRRWLKVVDTASDRPSTQDETSEPLESVKLTSHSLIVFTCRVAL